MNTQLVDSILQVIYSLFPEAQALLRRRLDLSAQRQSHFPWNSLAPS